MEMVELDKVFDELKEDLKDNADNEEVIEAMYAVIPQVGAIPIIRMLPLVLGERPSES